MKDYYAEFLTKNFEKTSESKVPKVPKGTKGDERDTFGTFGTERFGESEKIFSLSELLENPDLKEQFEFEIEERTAIMIFDGNLSEIEAAKLARDEVEETWMMLFVENVPIS